MWADVKMASVEWSKSAAGVLGLNADFENTLKTILCVSKNHEEDICKHISPQGAKWLGMKALSSAPLWNAGLAQCGSAWLHPGTCRRYCPRAEHGAAAAAAAHSLK